eukprot:m.319244 g.319244  ORF g.319244 m.319244 type:complete len:463 (+) comp19702_c0_seq13:292-1680(+)
MLLSRVRLRPWFRRASSNAGVLVLVFLVACVIIMTLAAQEQHKHKLLQEHVAVTEQGPPPPPPPSPPPLPPAMTPAEWLAQFPRDTSGDFRVHNNAFTRQQDAAQARAQARAGGAAVDDRTSARSILLATQCTASHLHYVLSNAQTWTGPISVAVLAADGDEATLAHAVVVKMRLCDTVFANKVSVHFVYSVEDWRYETLDVSTLPTDARPGEHVQALGGCATAGMPVSVANIGRGGGHLGAGENYAGGVPYPNNLLRNVAKHDAVASRVEWTTVLDVDLMVALDHAEFAQNTANVPRNEKIAFVFPAFEVRKNTPFPKTKPEVLQRLNEGTVQPFYKDLCWKCHRWTDYQQWVDTPSHQFTYTVPWHDPWEPFVIVRTASLPDWDERFRQYGFNRISQICEMHIAGFEFRVLSNAFVMHDGFKVKDGFHATKQAELDRNRILFRQFKRELKEKYPGVQRRC